MPSIDLRGVILQQTEFTGATVKFTATYNNVMFSGEAHVRTVS